MIGYPWAKLGDFKQLPCRWMSSPGIIDLLDPSIHSSIHPHTHSSIKPFIHTPMHSSIQGIIWTHLALHREDWEDSHCDRRAQKQRVLIREKSLWTHYDQVRLKDIADSCGTAATWWLAHLIRTRTFHRCHLIGLLWFCANGTFSLLLNIFL